MLCHPDAVPVEVVKFTELSALTNFNPDNGIVLTL